MICAVRSGFGTRIVGCAGRRMTALRVHSLSGT